ncbi:phage protein Gp37 [Desulfocurvibacter africanus]|uniref:Uncharacterized protein n=1 Tax=Desulfocurvibacter africanus subsp. africanus str. Walvis Bay TaxID=690850 RepID=F3YW18_DESAF|nr:phage protein Gp37 [Desulfocurvibacter africanus]EGJ49048.1 hypothetical protein Desaf_0696 [Desulfocurvibacter africanus subsp. africanus str. Walvis Bay]
MSLTAMREAIVAKIKAELPELKTVESHGGRFDFAELKRVSARTPAAFAACLGVSDAQAWGSGGEVSCSALWAVFVVVASKQRDAPRDLVAMALTQAVLGLLPDQRWGLDASRSSPGQIRADNLFSSVVDKIGVAMWGVSWRQEVDIANVDLSSLPDFLLASVVTTPAGAEDGAPALETSITLEKASDEQE